MSRDWMPVICLMIACCLSLSSVGRGDEAESVEESPVVLPSELDTDPVDLPPGEVGSESDTSPETTPSDEPSAEEDADPPTDEVSEEEFLSDPFSFLESDMQSAVVDLKDGRTHPPAEVTQPRILSHLDVFIAELEKRNMGAGNGGGPDPASMSTLKPGPGGRGEMRAPANDGRDWAELTPKEREKILQSRTDGFPSGFDAVLADYFRRVARGQESTAPKDDTATPDAGK